MGGHCGKEKLAMPDSLDSDDEDSDTDQTSSTASNASSSRTKNMATTEKPASPVTNRKGKTVKGKKGKKTTQTKKNSAKKTVGKSFRNALNKLKVKIPLPAGYENVQPRKPMDSQAGKMASDDVDRLMVDVRNLDSRTGLLVTQKRSQVAAAKSNPILKLPSAFNNPNPNKIYFENKCTQVYGGPEDFVKWEQTAITPQTQKYQLLYDLKKNPGYAQVASPVEGAKVLLMEVKNQPPIMMLPKVPEYAMQISNEQLQHKVVNFYEDKRYVVGGGFPQTARPVFVCPTVPTTDMPYSAKYTRFVAQQKTMLQAGQPGMTAPGPDLAIRMQQQQFNNNLWGVSGRWPNILYPSRQPFPPFNFPLTPPTASPGLWSIQSPPPPPQGVTPSAPPTTPPPATPQSPSPQKKPNQQTNNNNNQKSKATNATNKPEEDFVPQSAVAQIDQLRKEILDMKRLIRTQDTKGLMEKVEELLQNFKKMKQVYNKTLKQLANKDLGDLPQSSSESTQESHKKNLNDTLQDINSKMVDLQSDAIDMVHKLKRKKQKVPANKSSTQRVEIRHLNNQMEKLVKGIQTLQETCAAALMAKQNPFQQAAPPKAATPTSLSPPPSIQLPLYLNREQPDEEGKLDPKDNFFEIKDLQPNMQ